MQIQYRPEIDGLRAIAVLCVVVFHLKNTWLPGGFIGVDIFFVISGYLITSIIYNDCATDRFSFTRFYQRRIARIFPAFFTVALATIAAAAPIYTSQDFASAGANLFSAALSIANIKYMLQGNYFEISPDAQPFLHYWSLSVEEQFYIVFPILFYCVFKFFRWHINKLFLVLGMISLASCIIITNIKPVWAFYLLPTRAWELCAGCLLAINNTQPDNPKLSLAHNTLPIFGVTLILSSITLLHESPDFPGWQAIFPVTGAACILTAHKIQKGFIYKALSSRPMALIGKMSYLLALPLALARFFVSRLSAIPSHTTTAPYR